MEQKQMNTIIVIFIHFFFRAGQAHQAGTHLWSTDCQSTMQEQMILEITYVKLHLNKLILSR